MMASPEKRAGGPTSRLSNLLLLAGSLATACVIAEVATRVVYKPPWYESLFGEQAKALRSPYEINRHGLRGPDYPPVKGAGERRVLVLGDSFTFGQGVVDGEKVFPRILERRLNEPRGTGQGRVTVLNGGLPGSLTKDWLALWHRHADGFDPDVVLIVFFLRDGTRLGTIPGFFGEIRTTIAERNRRSRLYASSYLYRRYRDLLDRSRISELYVREFRRAYLGDERQTAEWRAAQENVLRLAELARRRGAAVGFVIFPILVELDDGYPFRDLCGLLEAFARTNALPVHSLLPAFLGEKGPELWVSPYDQHPNEKAHAIAAESMLGFLTELLEDRDEAK